jgi:hypothetical protein
MKDYLFVFAVIGLPFIGIAVGVIWSFSKWLRSIYRRIFYWWHYRKYDKPYKQKIEPTL